MISEVNLKNGNKPKNDDGLKNEEEITTSNMKTTPKKENNRKQAGSQFGHAPFLLQLSLA